MDGVIEDGMQWSIRLFFLLLGMSKILHNNVS